MLSKKVWHPLLFGFFQVTKLGCERNSSTCGMCLTLGKVPKRSRKKLRLQLRVPRGSGTVTFVAQKRGVLQCVVQESCRLPSLQHTHGNAVSARAWRREWSLTNLVVHDATHACSHNSCGRPRGRSETRSNMHCTVTHLLRPRARRVQLFLV